MFWGSDHTITGNAAFCTMIDDNETAMASENGLLCHPEKPERRFRSPSGDRFANSQNVAQAPERSDRLRQRPISPVDRRAVSIRQHRLRRRLSLEPGQRPLPS